MNHFIPLDQAKQMIALYKEQKETILQQEFQGQNILPISETFEVTDFAKLIAEAGCVKLRIYYGMSTDLNVHAIIVGVNAQNEEIIPTSVINEGETGILEDGFRCPPFCPPPPPPGSLINP